MSVKIYKDGHIELHRLLREAGAGGDATLVIPDLQRPYVWSPTQVVYLLDSLLRGWPFGTLLLWDTGAWDSGASPVERIPFRTFWSVVDRTGAADGKELPKAGAPTRFRMVLDGQQRVQSLLLAVGGDTWGFRLHDRVWCDALERAPSKGRNTRTLWTWGQLCLDVERLVEGYTRRGSVLDVDYVKALRWAVVSVHDGHGPHAPPGGYEAPLPRAAHIGAPLIRLSRLWQIASTDAGVGHFVYTPAIKGLLDDHNFTGASRGAMEGALIDFVLHLAAIKKTEIGYLQLISQDETGFDDTHYDDAVVNIFARLNTAGRTLTRQEITFAWVKRKWLETKAGRRADVAFEELRVALRDKASMDLDLDQLVSVTAAVWAAFDGNGSLLRQKDLLDGSKVEPLAHGLSERWAATVDGLLAAAQLLRDRRLGWGSEVRSVNAFVVFAVWRMLLTEWRRVNEPLPATTAAAVEQGIDALSREFTDRWFMLAQWDKLFARDTFDKLESYVRDLSTAWADLRKAPDATTARSKAADVMKRWLGDLVPGAEQYVRTVEVTNRSRVSDYTSVLWVWHRLDAARWAHSSITLRTSGRGTPGWHVDHLVSWASWQKRPDLMVEEGAADCHGLGNCAHLHSTLNLQKSASSLENFLGDCNQAFKAASTTSDAWADALQVPAELRNPAPVTAERLREVLEFRAETIRKEVLEFVRGERGRVDLPMDL